MRFGPRFVTRRTPIHQSVTWQVTWLPSPRFEAQALVFPVRGAPWWVLLHHSIMLRWFFIVECDIACFLCAIRVFDIRASSTSPDYLYAKFRFFRGLHCWASPWRKIAYLITQSLTQLIWWAGNRIASEKQFRRVGRFDLLYVYRPALSTVRSSRDMSMTVDDQPDWLTNDHSPPAAVGVAASRPLGQKLIGY